MTSRPLRPTRTRGDSSKRKPPPGVNIPGVNIPGISSGTGQATFISEIRKAMKKKRAGKARSTGTPKAPTRTKKPTTATPKRGTPPTTSRPRRPLNVAKPGTRRVPTRYRRPSKTSLNTGRPSRSMRRR